MDLMGQDFALWLLHFEVKLVALHRTLGRHSVSPNRRVWGFTQGSIKDSSTAPRWNIRVHFLGQTLMFYVHRVGEQETASCNIRHIEPAKHFKILQSFRILKKTHFVTSIDSFPSLLMCSVCSRRLCRRSISEDSAHAECLNSISKDLKSTNSKRPSMCL